MQTAGSSFVLGLLVGAGATALVSFLLFGADPGADAQRESLAANRRGEMLTPLVSSAEPALPAERRTAEDTDTKPVLPTLAPARVDELIAAARADALEQPLGAGSIQGSVLGPDHGGMAGVLLRARTTSGNLPYAQSPDDLGTGAPADESLENSVRKTIESYQRARAGLYETHSDSDGRFRFADLPEGEYRLEAYLRDWVFTAQGGAQSVPLGSEVVFDAAPVLKVDVSVFGPDGSPPGSATLRCKGGESSRERNYAWKPEAPYLRLTPGTYEVEALSGAFATARGDGFDLKAPGQRLVLAAGVTPAALRFDLVGRPGIRGRLRAARDGISGDSPQVCILPVPRGQEPDLGLLSEAEKNTWARPGEDFSFMDLQPGLYAVGAKRSWGGSVETHRVVEVGDTVVRCDLELPPLDLSKQLVVTVRDDVGQPLAGVDFNYRYQHSNGSSSGGTNELRAPNGDYVVLFRDDMARFYWGEPRKDDKFSLTLSHERFGQRTVELQPGQNRVVVDFKQPARLSVSIAGYASCPQQGRVTVLLGRSESDPNAYGWGKDNGTPSSEGVATFEAVEPGSYVLRLRVGKEAEGRNFRGDGRTVAELPIEVGAGENAATMVMPALYDVAVSDPEGDEGDNYMLQSTGDNGFWDRAELGADQRALFRELPAGHYTLSGGHGQMEIDVPCGVVQYQGKTPNALRVHIQDPQGKLAQAGLLEGDLIIGVNGEEFESPEDAYVLYRKKKAVSLLVLRGAERLELPEFELGDGFLSNSAGGSVEPTVR